MIVSGWQTANRFVLSLPADFVECLAIASDKTADQVRCILRLLEKQHFAYLATSPAWNITSSLLAPPPGFFTKYVKRRSLICQRFNDQT